MPILPRGNYLSYLECSQCTRRFDPNQIQTYCPDCNAPLVARYNLAGARRELDRDAFARRPRGMWRLARSCCLCRTPRRSSPW
jgi:threonine synthase